MTCSRRWISSAALAFVVGVIPLCAAVQDKPVDRLGSHRLGDAYEKFKAVEGFEDDPSRDDAAAGLKAARIIGPFSGQMTIQRLYFKSGKLARFSIIFGDPAFNEPKVKDLVAAEWGDPGPRMRMADGTSRYVWTGTRGVAMVLPADGGRWMASVALLD